MIPRLNTATFSTETTPRNRSSPPVVSLRMSVIQGVLLFSAIVLLSGWGFGYLLSHELKKHDGKAAPLALLCSLAAVLTPTVTAFALSSLVERKGLLLQFRFQLSPRWIAVSIAIPLSIALVGHIAGLVTSIHRVPAVPNFKKVSAALRLLPLALVWGLLEEIGWRGFLSTRLLKLVPAAIAFPLVGLLWGLWHAPQMFTNEGLRKRFHGRESLGAILWTGQCIALGCLLGWLQGRTGSFRYPTLAHALVNAFEKVSCGATDNESSEMNFKWAGNIGIPAISVSAIISILLLAWA